MRFKKPFVSTPVTRSTPFPQLPDWLSRQNVADYFGVGIRAADKLIRLCATRRKLGKFVRVHKREIARQVSR
jgi:hypothetical protein